MDKSLPRFGGHEILGFLGRGTTGLVYKARRANRRDIVALKTPFLHPEPEGNIRRLRFIREARTAAACSHSIVAAVYEVCDEAATPYIIREFVNGQTLETLVSSLDAVPYVRILRQIAEALKAIHHQGIIHRNLVPENVLIGTNGVAKLIGFSKARVVDNDLAQDGVATVHHDVQALHATLSWYCNAAKLSKNPVAEIAAPSPTTTAIEYAATLDRWLANRKG